MAFDPLDFHAQAVSTPSHESIDAMRSLLVETIEAEGIEAHVDGAGNVRARRGAEAGPHLLLNTHLDTVPPHVPYERDGDIVRGRGACDAKGPLAAMVGAFLNADPGEGRVTLAVTPDEETTQTGAAHLAETLAFDAAIVGEPTGLDVCHAARGQFEGTVTLSGESAHASDPGDGTNAMRAVGPAIEAMDRYDGPGNPRGPGTHETLGAPTLTPTMIEGGRAPNQVPAECEITFDRRSVPPEESAAFPASLQAHLRERLPAGIDVAVDLVRPDTPFPEAFETDPEARIVAVLRAAGAGAVRPFGAATEAAQFARLAPTVVFGPGVLSDGDGPVAHSPREYVSRREVGQATTTLTNAVEAFLDGPTAFEP